MVARHGSAASRAGLTKILANPARTKAVVDGGNAATGWFPAILTSHQLHRERNVMKLSRPRLAAASALAALAALTAATALTAAPAQASPARTATMHPASTSHVLVSCDNKDVVRPGSFVLSCADGDSGFLHMHWRVWGSTAYATATSFRNDCVPNCAQGKLYYFPALVVAWRPKPLPGHSSERYYSGMSWVYESKACLPSPPDGKIICLPRTGTSRLTDQP